MSERVDSNELLNGFRQVIAYRQIIKQISDSANNTLIWGGFLFGIWFYIYARNGMPQWGRLPSYAYIHLILALFELLVGLWKKLAPSPNAFLLDALVLLGFVASWGWRLADDWKRNQFFTLPTFFCVYMAFLAFREFKAWLLINRLLVYRPTREQLAQFDTFVRDVRRADPQTESNALALKTRPELRALLLGEIAFFVASTGDVIVTHRDDVEIEIREDPNLSDSDQPKRAALYIEDGKFGPFLIDSRNEANYSAWKAN